MDRLSLEKRAAPTTMTSVPGTSVPTEHAAVAAARSAGVEIRLLEEMTGLDQVDRLFGDIWDPDHNQPPVPSHLMRALAHAGGYVAGAFGGDEALGGCVGFFGAPSERTLHSHIAGVAPQAQGRRIGYALKLHQHAWAARSEVRTITWTFDPLVRRNAHFNLTKLGALPTSYLLDFYGDMFDGINAGQGSDRLHVEWAVSDHIDLPRATVVPAGATMLLVESTDGAPTTPRRSRSNDMDESGVALVGTPRDVETLRRAAPALARSWRTAVRDVLGGLLADGAQVVGFADGCYVVDATGSQARS